MIENCKFEIWNYRYNQFCPCEILRLSKTGKNLFARIHGYSWKEDRDTGEKIALEEFTTTVYLSSLRNIGSKGLDVLSIFSSGSFIQSKGYRLIIDFSEFNSEGDIKVYVIPDLDLSVQTTVQVQNILLKLIEEPPDHTALILTARSRETFLSTIISRCVSLAAAPVTMQESGEYLQENYPDRDFTEIREALEAGKGNIGRCRAYMEKEQYYNSVALAKNLAAAYSEGSEYGVLKALAAADGKKALLREGVYLFSEIVRDSCALLTDGEVIGCDTRAAEALSRKLTLSAGAELYDILTAAVRRIDANCSLSLVCNSLCAELF